MIEIERLVIVIRFRTHRDTRFGGNKNIEIIFSPTLVFLFSVFELSYTY